MCNCNKGIQIVSNGADDSQEEYCSCPIGVSREKFDTDFFAWLREEKSRVLNQMSV